MFFESFSSCPNPRVVVNDRRLQQTRLRGRRALCVVTRLCFAALTFRNQENGTKGFFCRTYYIGSEMPFCRNFGFFSYYFLTCHHEWTCHKIIVCFVLRAMQGIVKTQQENFSPRDTFSIVKKHEQNCCQLRRVTLTHRSIRRRRNL